MSVALRSMHRRPDTSDRVVVRQNLVVELEQWSTWSLAVLIQLFYNLTSFQISNINFLLLAVIVVEDQLWMSDSLYYIKNDARLLGRYRIHLSWLQAVSYTHLDVYKRQIQFPRDFLLRCSVTLSGIIALQLLPQAYTSRIINPVDILARNTVARSEIKVPTMHWMPSNVLNFLQNQIISYFHLRKSVRVTRWCQIQLLATNWNWYFSLAAELSHR